MKNSIDKLREQYEGQKRLEAEKAAQIKELEAALATLRSEQEAAAENDNIAEYERKAEEIKKIESRIYVATKSAKNIQKVTPETIRDAWREYDASYSKGAEKQYSDYLKHVAEDCAEYEGCVKGQNAALKIRDELIAMGADPEELSLHWYLPNVGAPEGFPHNHTINVPEFEFFAIHDFWKLNPGKPSYAHNIINIINAVVKNHKPVDECEFND